MNRLKVLRLEKKLNQIKLAMDLNTTQASISKYEQGKATPDIQFFIAAAEYFGVSVDYLLGRTPIKSVDIGNLDPQQLQLLNLYADLSQTDRSLAIAFLKGLKSKH